MFRFRPVSRSESEVEMLIRPDKLRSGMRLLAAEVKYLLRKGSGTVHRHSERPVKLSQLEERLLMSAAPAALALEVAAPLPTVSSYIDQTEFSSAEIGLSSQSGHQAHPSVESIAAFSSPATAHQTADVETEDMETPAPDAGIRTSPPTTTELVVIDSSVRNYSSLLADLQDNPRNLSVLMLTSTDDGLSKVTETLERLKNVSAIHMVTHGSEGEIHLGRTLLNTETVKQFAPELLSWQRALTSDADVLFYGCDIAATVEGQELLTSIQDLTDADVAASNNTTGHASVQGDWDLEFVTGRMNNAVVFSANVQESWNHVLAIGSTITVTTTADVVDADVSSVSVLLANRGADGFISLREAILAANSNADVDTILLGSGLYTFSLTGMEDLSAAGDLDILNDLIIRGSDADETIISAAGIDRVFDVRGTAALQLLDMTLTGGSGVSDGGGIRVGEDASLDLNRVRIDGNRASDNGGGVYVEGILTGSDVQFSGNIAATRDGGGVYNQRGSVTLEKATFSGNTARKGGAYDESNGGGALSLTNSTISGNESTLDGGGLRIRSNASLTNLTIAFNIAGTSGGGLSVSGGGVTQLRNTILSDNILASNVSDNVSGTIVSLGHNLDSDGSAQLSQPGDITGIDPQLSILNNHGGFAKTHALLSHSAAIDSGTSVGAPAADQRGVLRSGATDIGAFEYERSLVTTEAFPVNSSFSDDQELSAETRGSQQAVARDNYGNYVIVWSSLNQDGSGWGVYARRFDVMGRPLTAELQVNQTAGNDQRWARVASDANGNFVVTWTSENQDGTPESVYARRFHFSGTAAGAEFRVNTTATGSQKNSVIGMNSSGKFVIAWQGEGPGDASGVFFRQFNADGTAIDATDQRGNLTSSGNEINAATAMDDSGNFVIFWEQSQHIFFQRFSSGGAAAGGMVQVDHVLATSIGPAVAMDANGNFTVVYREDLIVTGTWGKGYYADGSLRYTWFQAGTGDSRSPSIGMSADGSYIVTWEKSGDGSGNGIYARKYGSNGIASGSEFRVNSYVDGNQTKSSIAVTDLNNFVVVWSGEGNEDAAGIYARQYGTATPAVLIPITDFALTPVATPVEIDVLSNDTYSDNRTPVILDLTVPVNGTATITGNRTILYTPQPGYRGPDSIQYVISDGSDGTVHYWSLSGNAVDSFGGSGTISGATTVSGSFGNALQFDETDDYVQIPDLTYSNQFTISFDFRIDENTGTGDQYLFSHGATNTRNSLNIVLGESERSSFASVLKTSFADDNDSPGLNALNFDASSLIGDGEWHTYTLTVGNNIARVWIDGAERASSNRGGNSFNPTGDLFVGTTQDQNASEFYGGSLDSLRVFDRALSVSEVARLDSTNTVTDTSQATGNVQLTVTNTIPVAVANGPGTISAGFQATFSAMGSSDADNDILTYEWDLNYDGQNFNSNVSGISPAVSWSQLQNAGITAGNYTVAVRVTDAYGDSSIATTGLTVLPNAAPTAMTLSSVVIPGGTSGAIVGALAVQDATNGDIHTWTINDNRFEIVGQVLKLRTGQTIHRAAETTVVVTVQATDTGGNTLGRQFNLTVANDPVAAHADTWTISENGLLTIPAPGVLANDVRSASSATSGAILVYDAGRDTDGDPVWQELSGNSAFNYTFGTGVTRSDRPQTSHIGILGAYEFDGSAGGGAAASQPFSSLPGDPTDGPVSFELWFRPESVTERYLLFDSGSQQPGNGVSLRLNGTQLEFNLVSGNTEAAAIADISSQLATGDFVQVTGTILFSGGNAVLTLFANGSSVATATIPGISSWSDAAENSGLGNVDGTASVYQSTGFVPLAGEIAVFRMYDFALNSGQVLGNFQAVSGVSSGLTVTGIDTATGNTAGSVAVSSTGHVTYDPGSVFDYLAAGQTTTDTFHYTVTDPDGNTSSASVSVRIIGQNDAPVMTAGNTDLGTMAASQTGSAVTVASILGTSATDADNGASGGIVLIGTSGVGQWQFSLDGVTWQNVGVVSTSGGLLLRSEDQLRFVGSGFAAGTAEIIFSAWDQSGGTANAQGNRVDLNSAGTGGVTPFSNASSTAQFILTAVNRAPVGVDDVYNLDEDTSLTTSAVPPGITGVLSNDTDADLDSLTVSLAGGPSHSQHFVLNSDGTFTYTPQAGFSGTDSFTYLLSDGTATAGPITVTLNIRSVNDPPTAIMLDQTSVAGYQDGAAVGGVTVTDDDAGDTHLLTVSDARFEIVGGQLKLKSGFQIDPVAETSIGLTIRAQDTDGAEVTQAFLLTVINTNQSPSLSLSSSVVTLQEDADTSLPIRLVSVIVVDDGVGINNLSLSGTDAGLFELSGSELYVRAGAAFDYESRSSYTVTVSVDDPMIGSGPEASAAFTLSIGNVTPVVSITGNSTTFSGQPFVLSLSAASPENASIQRWRIHWGDGITEDITGQPTTVSHTFAVPGGTRTITAMATDINGSPSSMSAPHIVTVINRSPGGIALSGTLVSDSTAGAIVGQISFVDPDVGDSHVLTISDNRFEIIGRTLKLKDGLSVNRTTDPSVDLTVSVRDLTGAVSSSEFTIIVQQAITDIVAPAPVPNSGGGSSSSQPAETQNPGQDQSGTGTTSSGTTTTAAPNSDAAAGGNTSRPASSVPEARSNREETQTSDNPLLMTGKQSNTNESDAELMFAVKPSVILVRMEAGNSLRMLDSSIPGQLTDDGSLTEVVSTPATDIVNWQSAYFASGAVSEFGFGKQMDSVEDEVNKSLQLTKVLAGSAGAVTTGLSVGYIIWILRGGVLLSGLLAQMPAWAMLDPLLVVDGAGNDDDRETIHTIVDKQKARLEMRDRASDAAKTSANAATSAGSSVDATARQNR